MRVLIVSDIHGNLEALRAVLGDAASRWDIVWNLGDIVGYGPDPSDCLDIVASLPNLSVIGNHDLMASGTDTRPIGLDDFNDHAKAALRWTMGILKPDEKAYLAKLPEIVESGAFTLVHGSPVNPIWQYIFSPEDVREAFQYISTSYCLSGHTHYTVAYRMERGGDLVEWMDAPLNEPLSLRGASWLLNPGSVGFPRDLASASRKNISPFAPPAAAAYAMLDTETLAWSFRRVPYNNRPTIKKMEKAGLLR
jgi:predicted phosphodiesterase